MLPTDPILPTRCFLTPRNLFLLQTKPSITFVHLGTIYLGTIFTLELFFGPNEKRGEGDSPKRAFSPTESPCPTDSIVKYSVEKRLVMSELTHVQFYEQSHQFLPLMHRDAPALH